MKALTLAAALAGVAMPASAITIDEILAQIQAKNKMTCSTTYVQGIASLPPAQVTTCTSDPTPIQVGGTFQQCPTCPVFGFAFTVPAK